MATAGELNRRQVLQLLAAGTGVALVRFPRALRASAAAVATSAGGFLTATELAILDAVSATLVPTDAKPGARECAVIDYVQNLLSLPLEGDANCDARLGAADLTAVALQQGPNAEASCPGADVNGDGVVDSQDVARAASALFTPMVARHARVFAGGPFSGRQAQPHSPTGSTPCQTCHVAPALPGAATSGMAAAPAANNYPPNSFAQTIPLTRLQALSWTIRILGADAVPAAADNPLATDLLETDLRRKYRNGLAALDAFCQEEFSGKHFVQLTAEQQAQVLADYPDQGFINMLRYHTIEGMLCPPEYGGNRNLTGWQLIGFGGDSQPLGYAIYDYTSNTYSERAEAPNSGPDLAEPCSDFSPEMKKFLTAIAGFAGGQAFTGTVYCLDVTP